MEEIILWIKELGFTTVAFLLVWWQGNTTIKENTRAINRLTEHFKKQKRGE